MSVHSSILHFKTKYRNFAMRFAEIAALVLCLFIIGKFLEYLLVAEDGFTKQLMEDFYKIDSNVDNIYLGSSHVHYDIKPHILDEITGENNFSLATGLQPMNTSYYLLREADKNNTISHVYLELSCGLTTGEYGEIKTYEQLPNSWRVLDYVKPSINKLQWMLDISEPEYFYLSFIPARRYYKELLDGNYIAGQLQAKAEDGETRWKGGYVYKGYRETDVVIDGMYGEKRKSVTFEKNPISDDVVEYLLKIINYCKKNQIGITLFTSPIIESELQNFINYDYWGDEVRQLAKENEINYFDFNLCKPEYLNLDDEQYWRDNNHLNVWGAEVYTKFVGEVFKAEREGKRNVSQYFYDNHQQKMQNMEETIFGMTIDEVGDEEKDSYLEAIGIENDSRDNYRVFLVSSVDNLNDKQVEYYFSLIDQEGGTEQIIQEWGENSVCVVPLPLEKDVLNVRIRNDKNSKSCKIFLKE